MNNRKLEAATKAGSQQEKARIESYWTARAEAFSALREKELQSDKYALWLQELLTYLPARKELNILDVGTGSGFFAIMLALAGHKVTGIDLSASMIDKAWEIADKKKIQAEFLVMDAEQLTFSSETFDAVIARNLTWTLPNPRSAYAEWLRVLKHGGSLINFDGAYGQAALKKQNTDNELPEEHAHKLIPTNLQQECEEIYQMLDVSYLPRPDWDKKTLLSLGCRSCTVDQTLGARIYKEIDQFYNPTPMFSIVAIK